MHVVVDTEAAKLTVDGRTVELYSPEGFEVLSQLWVHTGWGLRYSYAFSWMGRPIIQLPEDMIRLQEVIYRVKPDVLVETGVAHGGSLIFYASLFAAMGKGRVIGVDIEIRPHNRAAIEAHPMASRIALIEGSSTDPAIVADVRARIAPGETVLVVLDSNHTRAHVSDELAAYGPMVTAGSYIVATDGIMGELEQVPGGQPGWSHDNPTEAARQFAEAHSEFVLEIPPAPFDESKTGGHRVTYWPGAYLRRA